MTLKDRATAYARLVIKGERKVGKSEYLACKRHLDDIKRSKTKDFNYKFNVEASERAIDLANQLTILEGTEPKKLVTRGFQNFIIGSLHGWQIKRSGYLRYREAYIQIGRQNGKSFLSGTEINNRATFSGYQKGKIYCTATKQAQANIVWDEVEKFIIADKELSELYKIKRYERTIISKVTGTEIKSVGRDTKSADGFRSILAVVDEYHAHKNNQMYKLMLDGQIAVDSALTLAITTAGFDLNSPCYEQYKFSKKILEGVIDKESLFIYITEMDEGDDIWDFNNWAKANPLLAWKSDTEIDQEAIYRLAEKAIEAKEKGGKDLTNFLTKSLNRWVTYSQSSFVKLDAFRLCGKKMSLEKMRGKKAFLGIDLSSGGDLTSIALVFPLEDNKIYVYSHSFMPELRLIEHEKTDEAPYRVWVNSGLLTLTSGMFGVKTDYSYIISHLSELIQNYQIEIIACGYDPHNAGAFLSDLEPFGFDLISITQSARNLNEATTDFALSVEALQVLYDEENKLFMWSVANAEVTQNGFKEIKIEKKAKGARIDPIDAVIDAWYVMKAFESLEAQSKLKEEQLDKFFDTFY